ncbi:MAG: hypothetical protein ABIP29_06045 [Candidatus Eisenbacteria bacterium]
MPTNDRRPRFLVLAVAAVCAAVTSAPARAELVAKPVTAWSITHKVTLPGSPERAYDAATGDIAPWWDHTFHKDPKSLVIEPWAGGGFYEIWNEQGEGVRHAAVTWAERGKSLRLEGPLGLAGEGIVLVTTWRFTARGDSTELACVSNLTGTVPPGVEKAVDQVWTHFLTGRLKPYVESGRDRDKKPLNRPKS